jgi:seryl-tRNA synthetase
MDKYDAVVLRYLSEMTNEIKKIKTDMIEIKDDIKTIKKDVVNIMEAFPNGIEDHKKDHKKRKWYQFKWME